MILEGLMGMKVLALRLRTSATWSASPLMFFSSLKSDHLKGTINKEQPDRHTKTKNTKQKQRASHGLKLPPGKRKT